MKAKNRAIDGLLIIGFAMATYGHIHSSLTPFLSGFVLIGFGAYLITIVGKE